MTPLFPKPAKRKKERKPLRAKRWGVKRKARGTKHSRRPREWGFMAFAHGRGCELARNHEAQLLAGFVHACDPNDRIEFAHLSEKKRYDVGDIGAGLCATIHRGIDGKVGGKATWYVAMGKEGQRLFGVRLSVSARVAWMQMSEWEREQFEAGSPARERAA
jgi:hypothetical protein